MTMQSSVVSPVATSASASYSTQQFRRLCGVAARRLPKMIDPSTGLVVFSTEGAALRPVGTSVRYTAIAALGVERALQNGIACDVDHEKLLAALDAALPGIDDSGDIALVLWAAARRSKPLAERALGALLGFGPLTKLRRGGAFHSTELAWVVTALSEALAAGVGREHEVRARLESAWSRLVDNRGTSGLMGFARPERSAALIERVRSELGFFDAQVYSILAAVRFDEVVGSAEARDLAISVARHILRHQHPRGQWGWHYNAKTGDLVDLYPVYSVHQDGMAPMALLPLERRLGLPTRDAVAMGVGWLFRRNELGVPMVDAEHDVVWRSIRRRAPLRKVVLPLKALSLAGLGGSLDLGARLAAPAVLEVDRELRPYHLGWCLYGLAELAA